MNAFFNGPIDHSFESQLSTPMETKHKLGFDNWRVEQRLRISFNEKLSETFHLHVLFELIVHSNFPILEFSDNVDSKFGWVLSEMFVNSNEKLWNIRRADKSHHCCNLDDLNFEGCIIDERQTWIVELSSAKFEVGRCVIFQHVERVG